MRNDHHILSRHCLFLLICFLFMSSAGMCANEITYKGLLSFESKVDSSWVASDPSSLSISNYHYKHGSSSLKWNFKTGDFISVNNLNISLKKSSNLEPTFVCWIYNEHPIREGKLKFEFSKDGQRACWFEMGMNYKGWRAVWVNYRRDMKGKPVDGMNRVKIIAPTGANENIYFDHMVFAESIDPTLPTGDYQVPYVNIRSNHHWHKLLRSALIKPNIPLHDATEQEVADLETIEKRFFNMVYSPTLVTPSSLARLRKDYDFYDIRLNPDKSLIGRPIIFSHFADMYSKHLKSPKYYFRSNKMDMKSYSSLMYRIACAYVSAERLDNSASVRKELSTMFLNLRTHLMDQGWCEGSAMGTLYDLGYNIRNLYYSYFLMKDVLHRTRTIGQAQRDIAWFSGLGEVLTSPSHKGMSIEDFNTTIMGRLSSVLLISDPRVKVQYLNCFVRYLNNGLDLAPGLSDSFKPDGSVFHNGNNYPAFANAGFVNACKMVYILSQSGFAVSPMGHENLRRSLLMARLYCNKYVWPLSLSGKFPKGTGQLLTEYYKYMALAGTPDGSEAIDKEMAGAFLRLVDDADSDPQAQYIVEKGAVAEPFPSGNWAMNYSALSIHRRNGWSVTAHGHSRYLWASEHYADANNYGRFLTYGALEILSSKKGNTPSNSTSGFRQWGWDWARIPGTTTIHLPIDSLQVKIKKEESKKGNGEMLLSDEAFCGGLSFSKEYGVWAMKLHANAKYNASFKARKSVFFFDDKIVCLGSNIENEDNLYPTETTLFQTYLKSKEQPIELNNKKVDKFPYVWSSETDVKRDTYIKNNVGNFFYIPYKYEVEIERKHQISRDQGSKYRTENDFASAVINHGNAPEDASYEYVLMVQPTDSQIKHFIKAMRYDDSHPYVVQQMDREAHIVEDHVSNVKGYVFFERNRNVDDDLVSIVDMPCLMMSKKEKKSLSLSVCDPDIHIYNGPADVMFDENGKYIERPVLSRDWFRNEGKESIIKITLNGEWDLDSGEDCEVNKLGNNKTQLIFRCRHGMSNEVRLLMN